MPKVKISITVDSENVERAKELLETGRFRNLSHVFDLALARLLEEESRKKPVRS